MAGAAPTFKNSIGGEWVDAAGGESFETIVPATGEVLGSFPRSAAADVDRAVAAAKAAFEDWRLVPAPERGNILYRFAELLREHKDDLSCAPMLSSACGPTHRHTGKQHPVIGMSTR